jgi:hypothetical protein
MKLNMGGGIVAGKIAFVTGGSQPRNFCKARLGFSYSPLHLPTLE